MLETIIHGYVEIRKRFIGFSAVAEVTTPAPFPPEEGVYAHALNADSKCPLISTLRGPLNT